jgi:hypothetical protein
MNTAQVASKLVSLCKDYKNLEAMEELYADDIVSVEATPMNGVAEIKGKAAVIKKSFDWGEAHQINLAITEGPFVGLDKFAVIFDYDISRKATGERFQMREIAVYTVANGKIVREEFCYGRGEGGA